MTGPAGQANPRPPNPPRALYKIVFAWYRIIRAPHVERGRFRYGRSVGSRCQPGLPRSGFTHQSGKFTSNPLLRVLSTTVPTSPARGRVSRSLFSTTVSSSLITLHLCNRIRRCETGRDSPVSINQTARTAGSRLSVCQLALQQQISAQGRFLNFHNITSRRGRWRLTGACHAAGDSKLSKNPGSSERMRS